MTAGHPPEARIIPGTRTALAHGGMWVLVDRPLSHPLALDIWTALSGGATVDDVVDLLLGSGLRAAPAFVVASVEPEGVRVLARGAFSASGEGADGPASVPGQQICADVLLSGVDHLTLKATPDIAAPIAPLIAGMAPADGIFIRLAAPHAARAGAQAAADAPEPDVAEPDVAEPDVADPTSGDPLEPAQRDDASLAAIREYERLFGATDDEGSTPAADNPSPQPSPGYVELPGEPIVAEAQAVPSAPEPPAVPSAPELALPTVVEAAQPPSARPSGIIQALPDFFGPLAEATPSPLPSVTHSLINTATPPVTTGPGPALPPASSAPVQARTVNRAQLHAAATPTGPTVWAARCPVGHPSQAFAATCRVCGKVIPQQEPQEVARPVLGRLVVAGSPPIILDGDLILGRDPQIPPGSIPPLPRLVILNDPRLEVSSQHASITLNFWDVCVTDLGSTNGTEIITPDGRRQRLAQHTPVTIAPTTRIVLSEVLELLFEATG